MPLESNSAAGRRGDAALDLGMLADRFVAQRQPAATVHEVQALFNQRMASDFADATITQYLPILLWRQALERWPRHRAEDAAP
jgi:hypothetical protein